VTQPAPRHDAPAFLPSAGSLARKLSLFVPLSDSDRQALDALTTTQEAFGADTDIVSEGMTPRSVFLLQDGMAVRYRTMPDGRAPDHDVPDPRRPVRPAHVPPRGDGPLDRHPHARPHRSPLA